MQQPIRVEFMSQPAESPIPLPTGSIDTAVLTWTLCSVADPRRALHEIGRILKPDGRLLFIEHGSAPDSRVRGLQHWITPLWKRLAGGCHLDRQVNMILGEAGYDLVDSETGYLPGPRPVTFTYRGIARLRGEGYF